MSTTHLLDAARAVGELGAIALGLKLENENLKVQLAAAQRDRANCDALIRSLSDDFRNYENKTKQEKRERQLQTERRNYKAKKRKIRKKLRANPKFRPASSEKSIASRYWVWARLQIPYLRAELDAWKAARTK